METGLVGDMREEHLKADFLTEKPEELEMRIERLLYILVTWTRFHHIIVTKFPSVLSHNTHDCNWISAASSVCRREVIEESAGTGVCVSLMEDLLGAGDDTCDGGEIPE